MKNKLIINCSESLNLSNDSINYNYEYFDSDVKVDDFYNHVKQYEEIIINGGLYFADKFVDETLISEESSRFKFNLLVMFIKNDTTEEGYSDEHDYSSLLYDKTKFVFTKANFDKLQIDYSNRDFSSKFSEIIKEFNIIENVTDKDSFENLLKIIIDDYDVINFI